MSQVNKDDNAKMCLEQASLLKALCGLMLRRVADRCDKLGFDAATNDVNHFTRILQ